SGLWLKPDSAQAFALARARAATAAEGVMVHYPDEIEYSEKYMDDKFEYRHVMLPKAVAKDMYKLTNGKRLLEEDPTSGVGWECSRAGAGRTTRSTARTPHILLFRRLLGTDPQTGKVPEVR
ncbi:unnamed protein product, partial [Prorocentrum cordatum]